MKNSTANGDIIALQKLRKCILTLLYTSFQEHPYALLMPEELEHTCKTDSQTLNWNLVYLEKCGYLELGKSIENPPYITSSIGISAAGIDLVEDQSQLEDRFSTPENGSNGDA